jgi:hypothetical protein
MTIFLESPVPAISLGIVAGGALAFAWFVTARRGFAWAAAAVLLLAVGLVIVERVVETDTEKIEKLLRETAAAIEAHDDDKVLASISPTAESVRNRARMALKTTPVSKLRLKRGLRILFSTNPTMREAQATFHVDATVAGSPLPNLPIVVRLRLEEGQWMFYDYEIDHALTGGLP